MKLKRGTIDLLLIGLLLIILAIGFSSCCPKIVPVSSQSTESVDTMYIYRVDTVPVATVDTFRTGLLIDSLLEFLNRPEDNTVLSENSDKGVRTRIVYRDRKLQAECNIDSLRIAIRDSVIQVVKSKDTVVTNYVQECPVGWWKWVHYAVAILACIGIIALFIILLKR